MIEPRWVLEHEKIERLTATLTPYARTLFRFLRTEGGFTQRPSTRQESILWTRLNYRSTDLGVDVRIDYVERIISVWLVRLENGRFPKYIGPGSAPVNNVIIYRRIKSILRNEFSVSDPLLDQLEVIYRDSEREERDQEFLERMLELHRDLVHRYIDLLVSQPIARLFPVGGVYEPLHRSDVREALERQAQERFGFLTEIYGFSMHLDPEPNRWGSWVDFRSEGIGVSIEFDYHEHMMSVELVKLTSRQPPEGRALTWDQGVRVRAQVERVISVYLAQDDPLIGEIRRMFSNTDMFERDKGFFTAVLDKYEQLLKRHIEAILQAPLDVIFPHERPTWGVKDLDWR